MDREQTARDCLVIEKLGMSVLDFLRPMERRIYTGEQTEPAE